jgi:AcrR family transcriptional regulator
MAANGKSRARLRRDLILEAALRIADEEGLAALNMRRLAAQLDAGPMSLYRYFGSKDEILDGIVELVLKDLESPLGRANWTEASKMLFWSLRRLLCAHPNTLPLVASRPFSTDQGKRYAQDLLEVYRESGFDTKEASHLLSTLTGFTVGHVWILMGGFVGELPEEQALLRLTTFGRDGLSLGSSYDMSLLVADAEERFASGLRMILDRPTVANPSTERA